MSVFVLVHGSHGGGWIWQRVLAKMAERLSTLVYLDAYVPEPRHVAMVTAPRETAEMLLEIGRRG